VSRPTGTFNFSANFEPRLKAPLDARQVVSSFSDLINPSTWVDAESNVWLYDGAIVGVANDPCSNLNGIYLLLDAYAYTNQNSWMISGGSSGSTIMLASYKGTFNGTDPANSFLIAAGTHGLGTGPFNISVYENNEQVYTGVTVNINGDITLSWAFASLADASCRFIITG